MRSTSIGVFFDSNVLIRHLTGDRKAKALVDKVEAGLIHGYINQVVVSEVVYVYLRLSTKVDVKALKKNPTLCKEVSLDPVYELLELFNELASSKAITEISRKIIADYGLLPNDALIAATCKHYGIKKIATFDEDFKRVDFLEVVEI